MIINRIWTIVSSTQMACMSSHAADSIGLSAGQVYELVHTATNRLSKLPERGKPQQHGRPTVPRIGVNPMATGRGLISCGEKEMTHMKIRTLWLSAVVLCLTAGGAVSQMASPLNCQSITQNGKMQIVCDSADKLSDARSPAREEVSYTRPSRTADAQPADPNFCGRGFHYTADGCRPAKR